MVYIAFMVLPINQGIFVTQKRLGEKFQGVYLTSPAVYYLRPQGPASVYIGKKWSYLFAAHADC